MSQQIFYLLRAYASLGINAKFPIFPDPFFLLLSLIPGLGDRDRYRRRPNSDLNAYNDVQFASFECSCLNLRFYDGGPLSKGVGFQSV